MALLDRLKGDEEPEIAVHQFYAHLVGLADGQLTRSELETLFNIGTTGVDKTQLDVMINGYTAAADKGRYLTAVHAIFMLIEHDDFTLSNGQITSWLSAAEAAY